MMLEVPFVELQEFLHYRNLSLFCLALTISFAELKESAFRLLRSMQGFCSPNTEPNVKI